MLLLTARGEPGDRIEGLSLGADDYLPKAVRAAGAGAAGRRHPAPGGRRPGAAAAARPRPLRLRHRARRADPRRGARAPDGGRDPAPAPPRPRAARPRRAPPAGRRPRRGRPRGGTSRSPACAARSRPTRRTPATCRRCGAWATCWRRTDGEPAGTPGAADPVAAGQALAAAVALGPGAADDRCCRRPDAGGRDLGLLRGALGDGDGPPVRQPGGDVEWVAQSYEDDPSPIHLAQIQHRAEQSMDLSVALQAGKRLPTEQRRSFFAALDRANAPRPVRPAGPAVLVRHHPLPRLRRHPRAASAGGAEGAGAPRPGLRGPGRRLRDVAGRGDPAAHRDRGAVHQEPGARHRAAGRGRGGVRARGGGPELPPPTARARCARRPTPSST